MSAKVTIRRNVVGAWRIKCPSCDFDKSVYSWGLAFWWANSHAGTHWAVSAA